MAARQPFRTGVHYLLLYALTFSVMGVCIKLAARMPSEQIASARIVITLVATFGLLKLQRVRPLGRGERKLLILRGITGTLALNCIIYGMARLPLAEAVLIQSTTPVFTGVMAAIFLRERRDWRVPIVTLISILGVLIMTRPATMLGLGPARLALVPVLVTLAGAAFTAASFVVIRKIGDNEHPLVVVFYAPLVGIILTLPFTVHHWVMPRGAEWGFLIGVGIATQLGQMALSEGLRREPVARATNLTYAQIVFAAIWGALLFGEYPDLWSVVGAIIVIAAATFTTVTSRRANPRGARVAFDVDVTTPLHLETLLAEISRHEADTAPMRLGADALPSRVRPAQR